MSFQRHFRKIYNGRFTGHPVYVYGEDGGKYKVLGLTSAPETNGVKNILLEVNPEPHNKSAAYIRPAPRTENKGAFGIVLKGWHLNGKDKKTVQKIIELSEVKKGKKKKEPRTD